MLQPYIVFRPPSDGGLMIPPWTLGHVFVKRLVYIKVKIKKRFKRSARFKRNFRHNCMPVLGLA